MLRCVFFSICFCIFRFLNSLFNSYKLLAFFVYLCLCLCLFFVLPCWCFALVFNLLSCLNIYAFIFLHISLVSFAPLFLSIASRRGTSIGAMVAILLGHLPASSWSACCCYCCLLVDGQIYIRFRYYGRTPRYLSSHSGCRRTRCFASPCALLLKCCRSL